jgi:hypothetical protein
VLVGLYVRLAIHETPVFHEALARHERVKLPMQAVLRDHAKAVTLGTLIALATFVLFSVTLDHMPPDHCCPCRPTSKPAVLRRSSVPSETARPAREGQLTPLDRPAKTSAGASDNRW